jgi:hypothetical protein
MPGSRRVGFWLAVSVHSLVILTAVISGVACSCLPTVYEEINLASVPPLGLRQARERAPGFLFHRAWIIVEPGIVEPARAPQSILLRGRAGWYESRDIEVALGGTETGPQLLEPIPIR